MQLTSIHTNIMRIFLRNNFLNIIGLLKKPKPGVHIINAHFVTPDVYKKSDWDIFDDYLKYIQKSCKLISIQEATNTIFTNRFPTKDCLVAFTFDDGFFECHSIIAPLLEKYNCNAAFFVCAKYIDSSSEYQNEFHGRIQTYNKRPMTWNNIIELHNRGHVIGSHTLDHVDMAKLSNDQMIYQLSENKKILESKLDYNCEYFAWTYGQFKHFPSIALKYSLKFHKYIFSATNYKQYFSFQQQVVNRRHIEPFWPKGHINYFLSVDKK